MQENPTYTDVSAEVSGFLQHRAAVAMAAGVDGARIILDPGIGFGKTLEHNLKLLHDLKQLCSLGFPVLIGVSRKRFIGTLTGVEAADQRVIGSCAGAAWSVINGAAIVRVHDVEATRQTLKVIDGIANASVG
jgi:dihydropteroate synthase